MGLPEGYGRQPDPAVPGFSTLPSRILSIPTMSRHRRTKMSSFLYNVPDSELGALCIIFHLIPTVTQ